MNKFKEEKHYKIPVVWEMHGIVEIKGESKEEAIENFKRQLNVLNLPEESYYVDESFKCSYDDE